MHAKGMFALAAVLLVGGPGFVVASHLVAGNPESLVTGHTVLTSNVMLIRDRPTDFAALAGLGFAQRRSECVVWSSGLVTFDGTLGETLGDAPEDNGADPCGQISDRFLVIAVEAGDCDPRDAAQAEFVRDLSFDDPNGVAHIVAELRYRCGGGDEDRLALDSLVDLDAVDLLLPATREYAWVTEPHVPVIDPTLDDNACLAPVSDHRPGLLGADPTGGKSPEPADLWDDEEPAGQEAVCAYNFALVVDTCTDDPTPGDNARTPETRCTDGGGEEFATGHEHRGARFDDTARSIVVHDATPSDQHEIRDGNSNTWPSTDPDNHREDKTADPCYPPETGVPSCGEIGETDYDAEEDHLGAAVDVFASAEGCTGVDADDDGADDGARTPIGVAFCRAKNGGALTPLLVNHPGCVKGHDAGSFSNAGDPNPGDGFPEGDLPASPSGNCWDLPRPPDDAPGAG